MMLCCGSSKKALDGNSCWTFVGSWPVAAVRCRAMRRSFLWQNCKNHRTLMHVLYTATLRTQTSTQGSSFLSAVCPFFMFWTGPAWASSAFLLTLWIHTREQRLEHRCTHTMQRSQHVVLLLIARWHLKNIRQNVVALLLAHGFNNISEIKLTFENIDHLLISLWWSWKPISKKHDWL